MGGKEEREGERESGRRGKREMPLTSKKGHLLVTYATTATCVYI